MYLIKRIILPALTLILFWSCASVDKIRTVQDKNFNQRIAFYNVENLFDTIDDTDSKDDEFLPGSKKDWTLERYNKKLADLSKVIAGMNYPMIVGICEVENEKVVKDLTSTTALSKIDYAYVHHNSNDHRGIDVAMIYDKKLFEVKSSESIIINFPKEVVEDYTTRDILYVNGVFNKSEEMHLFVNHWPSRRGGEAESEPKRTYVAQQLKDKISKIKMADQNAKILVMGDFNDEPINNSIAKTLGASDLVGSPTAGELYNCFAKFDAMDKGSYNYRGTWNMLDQVIVSGSFLNKSETHISNPGIFQQEWMMYNDKKRGPTPNRTYGGPNYYGGFSDHLPVYVELIKKGK